MKEPASSSLFSLSHSKHVRKTLRVFFDCLDPMNKYEQVKGRARQETPHTVVSPSPPNTNRVITPNFGRRRRRRLFKGSTALKRCYCDIHSRPPGKYFPIINGSRGGRVVQLPQSLSRCPAPPATGKWMRSADSIDSSGPTDLTEWAAKIVFGSSRSLCVLVVCGFFA